MRKIKVEWCENFIKKTFAKLPEFGRAERMAPQCLKR